MTPRAATGRVADMTARRLAGSLLKTEARRAALVGWRRLWTTLVFAARAKEWAAIRSNVADALHDWRDAVRLALRRVSPPPIAGPIGCLAALRARQTAGWKGGAR
ncbi:MAG: hypothetical protein ABFD84_01045 [Candidatus Polarisedimenticolia bacterium]